MAERDLLATFEEEFHKINRLADRAIAQVDDAGLHLQINPRQNSIAAIMQHVAGNAVSRWTDFLTTDGEKPERESGIGICGSVSGGAGNCWRFGSAGGPVCLMPCRRLRMPTFRAS